jgi:hypothetical protein
MNLVLELLRILLKLDQITKRLMNTMNLEEPIPNKKFRSKLLTTMSGSQILTSLSSYTIKRQERDLRVMILDAELLF